MHYSRDYILRMVEQLNRAIATLTRQRQDQRYEDALDTVGDTVDDLLGHQAHFLATLDPPSVARILGKWPRIKIYAALLEAEADVRQERGEADDPAQASRLRRRALSLLLLGYDKDGRGDPDLLDRARALARRVPLTELSTRLRDRARALELDAPGGMARSD